MSLEPWHCTFNIVSYNIIFYMMQLAYCFWIFVFPVVRLKASRKKRVLTHKTQLMINLLPVLTNQEHYKVWIDNMTLLHRLNMLIHVHTHLTLWAHLLCKPRALTGVVYLWLNDCLTGCKRGVLSDAHSTHKPVENYAIPSNKRNVLQQGQAPISGTK